MLVDANCSAISALAPHTAPAKITFSTGDVDLPYHPLTNQLWRAINNFRDELMSQNPRKAIHAFNQLEIGVADSRLPDLQQCLVGFWLRLRYSRVQPQAAVKQERAHVFRPRRPYWRSPVSETEFHPFPRQPAWLQQ